MGNTPLVDMMISDGLSDIYNGCHMGITAEEVAKRWVSLEKNKMPLLAVHKTKLKLLKKLASLKEIVPVVIKGRKGDTVVDKDEFIKYGVTHGTLAKARPAFAVGNTKMFTMVEPLPLVMPLVLMMALAMLVVMSGRKAKELAAQS